MPYRWLITDEWYPVLLLGDNPGGIFAISDIKAEFSESELAEIQKIQREFNMWQATIADRFGIKRPSPSFIGSGAADL